jgi:AMIN domain
VRRPSFPSTILLLGLAFAGGAGFAGDGRSANARSIGVAAGFAGDGRSAKARSIGVGAGFAGDGRSANARSIGVAAGFAGDGRSANARTIGVAAGFAGDGRSPQGGALATADDRARLLSVSAAGDADSAVIAFEGDRPLSFTTLQLQTPPRVVVDFADTSVAGVPAELSVEDGTVRRVATAEVGAGTARVVIELAADAEFDVRAKGNRLEVRVARIAPFVASGKPAETPRPPEQAQAQPPPAAKTPETPSAPAPAEQIAQAPAPQAPPAAQQPPPAAQQPPPAAQQPAPAQAAAEAPPTEAEKRASLPTVSLVGSRPSAPAPQPLSAAELKKKRAAEEAAESKRRAREQRLAAAKAAADRLAEKRRAAVEKRATAAAEKKAAADRAAAEKQAAREARALAAAEKQKKAREVAAAEPPRRQKAPEPVEPKTLTVQEAMALREANDKGLPTGLGPAPEPPAPAQSAKPEAPARRTARAESPRAGHSDSSRIAINSIGFRPVGNGEVIIRSDRPLTYGVGGDEHAVLLHLPGSAIPRPNDRRPLDTHFFDGPVLRVVPVDVPGGVDLRIELRAKAEYQLSQQGAVLTVVFAAPK